MKNKIFNFLLSKTKIFNFFRIFICSPSGKNSTPKKKFTERETLRHAGRDRVLQMMASQGKGLRKQDWLFKKILGVLWEISPQPSPPQQKNPKALCQGGGDPCPAILKMFSRSHKKKRVGYCMCGGSRTHEFSWEFLYSRGGGSSWGFCTSSSSGRPAGPLGFLYSWVLLMFCLGTLSGGPPLGEPSCTGTSPTMSWFLFAQNLRAAS